MAESSRRRPAFLGRLAQLSRETALSAVARNLGFVFNTRKACGSVVPEFGIGDYELESNTRHAVEVLRLELLAAVAQHEPRMARPSVLLLGRYGYNMVRFEISGVVDGRPCSLGVDIDTTTRHVEVLLPESAAP